MELLECEKLSEERPRPGKADLKTWIRSQKAAGPALQRGMVPPGADRHILTIAGVRGAGM